MALLHHLALWWLAAAFCAAGIVLAQTRFPALLQRPALALALASVCGSIAIWIRHRRKPLDIHAAALQIERRFPELDTLLLAALAQSAPQGRELNYLQQRVIDAARDHHRQNRWLDAIPRARIGLAHAAHWGAFALFVAALASLQPPGKPLVHESQAAAGVFISPGDTNIEKGSSLVVLARFSGPLPAKAALLLTPAQSGIGQIPMLQNLADPVFGGSILNLEKDFEYQVDYAGRKTRMYKVGVFEYPRLERADAEVIYPDYTGAARKRIQDTRRITAVEGSKLNLVLQLNKPAAQARLLARDKSVVPLAMTPGKSIIELREMPLVRSMSYDLQLIDSEGRTNRSPAAFAIDVQPNRPAQIKIAAPKGDLRPSALEEIRFEAEVWDDFGIHSSGLSYTLGGGETKTIPLSGGVPGGQKKQLSTTLRLEEMGVKQDDLISYYFWAEDTGPGGNIRRQASDIFFAEIRPFDEVFRQGQSQESSQQEQQQQEGQGGEGNQPARLAQLQKQIIGATWKLQQQPGADSQYRKDAAVIADSQSQALAQAGDAGGSAADPKQKAFWNAAIAAMEQALKQLKSAADSPAPLPDALKSEQAAYQALLKLQAREHEVAQNRRRGRNSSGDGQDQTRQQLRQMDLTQPENRYETQNQAAPRVSEERRENMQTLNRLQELAKRQQDLNERLKELQTALQEAGSEKEKEEVRRRLKRLREQEQELVDNSDELRQRMQQGNNQQRLASEREQLDRAREQMRNASDAIEQGSVSQAMAAGSRARQELQQMRDNMRRQSASQFSDAMRQMRGEAQSLEETQEAIAREMDALQSRSARTLSDAPERKNLQDRLDSQRQRMTNLLAQAGQISEQSENSEPLLSRQLYDTLRRLSQEEERNSAKTQTELMRQRQLTKSIYDSLNQQDSQAKSLKIAGELLKQGSLPQAGAVEKRARSMINQLRSGVERAAESVLGDETEALRMAGQELETLADQANREISREERQNTEPAQNTENQQAGNRNADRPSQAGADGNRTPASGNLRANGEAARTGPIAGDDFAGWSDRLREVEEMLDQPELRQDVASAREAARQARLELRRNLKKPDWARVRLKVVKPLLEVRSRIAEDLARRDPGANLAPIDRDPVPNRYTELVRRYYEQLGKDESRE